MPPFPKRKTAKIFVRTVQGVSRIQREGYSVNGGGIESWYALGKQIAEEVGYRCEECGSDTKISGYHTHHIIPLSRGGLTIRRNLRHQCPLCHDRKHTHSILSGIRSQLPATYADKLKKAKRGNTNANAPFQKKPPRFRP